MRDTRAEGKDRRGRTWRSCTVRCQVVEGVADREVAISTDRSILQLNREGFSCPRTVRGSHFRWGMRTGLERGCTRAVAARVKVEVAVSMVRSTSSANAESARSRRGRVTLDALSVELDACRVGHVVRRDNCIF